MPYCTNCGGTVDSRASFCPNCGTAQPRTGAQPQFDDFLGGMSDRTACILCYIPVLGIIPAIVFLASHRYRRNVRVRFNAFQSLYLFVAWLIVSSAAPTLLFINFPGWEAEHALIALLKIAMFVCWIYLLVKAAHEEQVKIPIIGDLAARSTTEQL
jgi:uncharacterized membrane protein